MNYMIVTQDGHVAEHSSPHAPYPSPDERRRTLDELKAACERMNRDAEALGIVTRYKIVRECPRCEGTGKVGGWLSHELPRPCGFCVDGVPT